MRAMSYTPGFFLTSVEKTKNNKKADPVSAFFFRFEETGIALLEKWLLLLLWNARNST